MIFYDADGYVFLNRNNEEEPVNLKDWVSFVSYLYRKIFDGKFISKSIQYTPGLTKVQIYKLKKMNLNIPEVSINGTLGTKVDEVGFRCNLLNHTGIENFYSILKQIRNKPNVQDVLVEIMDVLSNLENKDNDTLLKCKPWSKEPHETVRIQDKNLHGKKRLK